MIEKDPPFFWDVTCDFCSEDERVSVDVAETFYCLIDHIKELGWRVFKLKGEWQHQCPVCCEGEFDDG